MAKTNVALLISGLLALAGWLSPSLTFAATEPGWNLTVYYTAVESFHHGIDTKIRGCEEMGCERKRWLGSFPKDFVQAVQDEGAGRITIGEHAGKYLCWSKNDGYWIDTEPKDAEGGALIPWLSAAADPKVMNFGAQFKVEDCGRDDTDGSAISAKVCDQIKSATWKVMDRFEPGLGGERHLDLYIGEEDQPDFVASSPKVVSVKSAAIKLTN
jgi:hypothetical protein